MLVKLAINRGISWEGRRVGFEWWWGSKEDVCVWVVIGLGGA
jgi:hypothetical protein